MFVVGILSLSLVACSDSARLSEDQYQVSHQGKTFTIKVTDTDIDADDIETVEVKLKYKYTVIEYSNGSVYADDIDSKTKTETFVVEKFDHMSGNFMGSFTVDEPVFEYECEKVVAYYADGRQSSNDEDVSILEAIGFALLGCVGCVVCWVILALFMDVNTAFCIACIPGVVIFLGLLVTGQWIPAIIVFLSIGASLSIAQAIYNKICN